MKVAALILGGAVLFSSCASTTVIRSNPSGAKVYLNGEPVGTTPYSHTDTKIVGSSTSVRLEKEGFQTMNTSFSRDEQADVGAIIGGLFVLVPFLWTMKYNPTHTYELSPLNPDRVKTVSTSDSKTIRIRELKKLLDEKLITKEEYDKAKKKILEE